MSDFYISQYKYPDIPLSLWEDLLVKASSSHLMQSPLWAELRKKLWDVTPFFLLFTENKIPIGFLLFFKEAFKNQFLAQHPPLSFLVPATMKFYPVISWNCGPVFLTKELEERYLTDVLSYIDNFVKMESGLRKNIRVSFPAYAFRAPDEYKKYPLEAGYNVIPQDNFYIDLSRGADALWKRFKNSVRKNINRCIEEHVEVRTLTTIDEYRQFYNVYTKFRKDNNLYVFPFSHLLAHVEILKPKGHFELFAAFHDKRIIATLGVNIYNGIITEVLAANSVYSSRQKLNPNDFIKWEIIKWGCQKGYRIYDLGGVERNPQPGSKEEGILRFKSKFAGVTLSNYLYSKDL
jgi:lipid II:glycine glycyltransferase (peptidoglycan interpeptide bridge formation enzyme)